MSHAPFGAGMGAGPPPGPPRRSAPWGIIGAVLGLLGLVAGVGAWMRPMPEPAAAAPVYSEQQVADAKAAVCEAYRKADRGVAAAGRRTGGDDPTAQLAVAVNVRLALTAGSENMLRSLESNPAVPENLATPVRNLASAYRYVAIGQLGEAPDQELAPTYRLGDAAADEIKRECR